MDLITSITTAITLGRKAMELSKNVANQEIRQIVFDVSEQLLQVRSDSLELKEENLRLREENAALKQQIAESKPQDTLTFVQDHYVIEGREGQYCAHCYDESKNIRRLYPKSTENYAAKITYLECLTCKNKFQVRSQSTDISF